MATPKPPVEIDKNGKDPKITVIIGKAQGGSYRVQVTLKKKPQPAPIEGQNDDDVADVHTLGKVADLNSALVSWRLLMSASNENPGQLFMATILITQDGIPVKNGTYQYNSDSVFDIVRLKVS